MGGRIVERGLRAPQIAIVLKSRGRAHVCVCVGETLVTFLTVLTLEGCVLTQDGETKGKQRMR